jgi:large subunit ribosomal protein L9|tara:strand:- start:28764 stop:29210 length:447 start_codon:yes stop_codon:yes gene_type:complete
VKVLLRSDVDGLGRTGDIVEVARGYARNFLVPQGLAVGANAGIAAQAETMQRKREMKSVAERADAEVVAGRIAGLVLHISAKASDEGRLFGSVGPAEVVDALAAQAGLETDRSHVLGDTVKDVGLHEFTVQLHPEVAVPVGVEVEASD